MWCQNALTRVVWLQRNKPLSSPKSMERGTEPIYEESQRIRPTCFFHVFFKHFTHQSHLASRSKTKPILWDPFRLYFARIQWDLGFLSNRISRCSELQLIWSKFSAMASIRPMMLEDLLHFNAAWLQKRPHEPRPKFTSSVRVTLMGITIMFASLLHLKISHCCHCFMSFLRNLRRWIWMSSQRPSIWTSTSIISLDGQSAVLQLDCLQCET